MKKLLVAIALTLASLLLSKSSLADSATASTDSCLSINAPSKRQVFVGSYKYELPSFFGTGAATFAFRDKLFLHITNVDHGIAFFDQKNSHFLNDTHVPADVYISSNAYPDVLSPNVIVVATTRSILFFNYGGNLVGQIPFDRKNPKQVIRVRAAETANKPLQVEACDPESEKLIAAEQAKWTTHELQTAPAQSNPKVDSDILTGLKLFMGLTQHCVMNQMTKKIVCNHETTQINPR